jgi:hypothetical protein
MFISLILWGADTYVCLSTVPAASQLPVRGWLPHLSGGSLSLPHHIFLLPVSHSQTYVKYKPHYGELYVNSTNLITQNFMSVST